MKLSLLFILCFTACFSQKLQRQSLSPIGTHTEAAPGILIRQSIGQPYQTNTNYTTNISFRPGFQQPAMFIEKIASTFALGVYPNPTQFIINLHSEINLNEVEITIVDNSGKVVYNTLVSDFLDFQINCASWAGGTYLLTVNYLKEKYSARLILSR